MSCRQQAGRDKQFMKKKEIKIKKILKIKKKAMEVKTKSAAPWDIMSNYQDLIAGIFFSFSLSLSLSTCTSAHIILMSFTRLTNMLVIVSVQAN